MYGVRERVIALIVSGRRSLPTNWKNLDDAMVWIVSSERYQLSPALRRRFRGYLSSRRQSSNAVPRSKKVSAGPAF